MDLTDLADERQAFDAAELLLDLYPKKGIDIASICLKFQLQRLATPLTYTHHPLDMGDL
jgi:hypothetical protein